MSKILKLPFIMNLCLLLLFTVFSSKAQVLTKDSYKFKTSPQIIESGLLGNGITDILTQDTILWVATGFGLNKTPNEGDSWINFTSGDYIGKGGVTAITLMDSTTLWIATSFDTTTDDEVLFRLAAD